MKESSGENLGQVTENKVTRRSLAGLLGLVFLRHGHVWRRAPMHDALVCSCGEMVGMDEVGRIGAYRIATNVRRVR